MGSSQVSGKKTLRWRKDGIFCLSNIFDQEWMEILKTGYESACNKPRTLKQDYADDCNVSLFVDNITCFRVVELYDFDCKSAPAKIAAGLLQEDEVNLIDDHLWENSLYG